LIYKHILLNKTLCDVSVAVAPRTSGFSLHLRERTASTVVMETSQDTVDMCMGKSDGYHTGSSCTSYWLCKGGKAVLQRSCSEGTLFNGLMCVPSALVTNCIPVNKGSISVECIGLKNGLHRNYLINGCSHYVICENGNTILKGSCKHNLIFDGNLCTENKNNDDNSKNVCNIENNHTEDDMECSDHKMSGVYTNSNCQNYYYCNSLLKVKSQIYECPIGYTFNINLQKCVPGLNCSGTKISELEEIEFDFCFDKNDGYYQDTLASGCRSYVFCNKGKKIIYLCPEGYAFDGTSCKVDTSFTCPYWSKDCIGKQNGYHSDLNTGCRQYFYCLNENKVMTLTCSRQRIFDGSKCIPQTPNSCEPLNITNKNICDAKTNGRHIISGSKCQNFITCYSNRQISSGSCAEGFIFVGDDCIKQTETAQCVEEQS
jgi:hypothetical protein